ncbi:hypothetical protein ACH4U6_01595 [Streptomyces netropsis]|uniref:hypothetical protein n=1 Tax=Streptomyces netropsis TaxID=55404 RepID=UPI0037AA06F8
MTSAPIPAPRPIGSRPSGRPVSAAARSATRAGVDAGHFAAHACSQVVVSGSAVAPVQDLLAGQVLKDQLLVDVVSLRLRRGDNGSRARGGQYGRGYRRGQDASIGPRRRRLLAGA